MHSLMLMISVIPKASVLDSATYLGCNKMSINRGGMTSNGIKSGLEYSTTGGQTVEFGHKNFTR